MYRASLILLIAASIGLSSAIVDYCNRPEYCKGTGHEHVTCGATGGLGPACPPGASSVNLSKENIQQIVHIHNKLRNQLASGNLGFAPAAKMNTVVCILS